jgi:hypothetical protein
MIFNTMNEDFISLARAIYWAQQLQKQMISAGVPRHLIDEAFGRDINKAFLDLEVLGRNLVREADSTAGVDLEAFKKAVFNTVARLDPIRPLAWSFLIAAPTQASERKRPSDEVRSR